MEIHIENLEALSREAKRLVERLVPQSEATLVALSGELGVGKTTFTQALAKTLGVLESVTSPTFVLEKIYELPSTALFRKLVHIDAYRLDGGSELKALGFSELMHDPSNLVVLEWPERVSDGLPKPTISITLTPNADGSRTMIYG